MDCEFWQLRLFSGILFLAWIPYSICDQDGSMVFVKEVPDEDSSVVEDFLDGQQHEIFVPSKVWQKVKPGQPLPSGLHYRINLSTGEKEAKLLDKEDQNQNTGSQQDSSIEREGWKDKSGKFNFMTAEQLKTKFASLPDDGPKNLNANEPYEPNLSQYKDIDELKRDFEALNAQIQTESEIVTELVSELRSTADHPEDVLLIKLEDLSFYMHQIDNAQDFVLKMDGLGLIRKFLNHTKTEVQQYALKVLTACLQANQKLKVFAIENGQVLNLLAQILTSGEKANKAVTKSALYSLSALLRNFPFAQKLFADMNGFDLLCDLVHSGILPSIKVLQLKTDLIMEAKTSLEQTSDLKKEETDLLKQYEVAGIQNKVGCACSLVTSDLETALENIDSLEKIDSILEAVTPFQSLCPLEEQRKWSSRGEVLQQKMKEVLQSKMRSQNGNSNDDALEYHAEVMQKLSNVLDSFDTSFAERHEL